MAKDGKLKDGLIFRGKYYHYHFVIEKVPYRGSCHTDNLTVAKEVLRTKRNEVALGLVTPSENYTVAKLSEVWLKHIKSIRTPGYHSRCSWFMENVVLPEIGTLKLKDVKTLVVSDIVSKYLETHKISTTNTMMVSFKAMFHFAMKLDLIQKMPFFHEHIKDQNPPRDIIVKEKKAEFLKLLSERGKNGNQLRLMAMVGLYLGMRESEIFSMTWEAFNKHNQTYTVSISKSKKSRILPIPQKLFDELVNIQTKSGLIFPNEFGNPHIKLYLSDAIKRIGLRMNLRIGSHSLRRSFATYQIEVGTSLVDLQLLLGHSSIAVTAKYVQELSTKDRKQTAQERLSAYLDD